MHDMFCSRFFECWPVLFNLKMLLYHKIALSYSIQILPQIINEVTIQTKEKNVIKIKKIFKTLGAVGPNKKNDVKVIY